MLRNQKSSVSNTQYNGSIHHDGFKFHRKYIGKNSCTYWCANNRSKDSLCSAKIKICPKGDVLKTIGKHDKSCFIKQEATRKALGLISETTDENGPPDLSEKMLQMAEDIALKNMSMPPKKIHLQVLQDMEMKHNVFRGATNTKIINRIKNARTRMNGNDVFRIIESENLAVVKDSNQFFLHFNVSYPNEDSKKYEKILGFGNPALFRCLGGNDRIFIDGTFKIVPKPFYQCLIIMVFDEQTDAFVPVFYILLTSKTEAIYRIALSWVKLTSNYKIRPKSITCDFEKALHNAIAFEFPQTYVNGCLFHWKQAICRKVKELKFSEFGIQDRFTHRFSLEQLTLIPPNEITKFGIPYCRENIEYELQKEDLEKMETFWNYFYKTWMSRPSVINSWNRTGYPKTENQKLMKTNNALERYNRELGDIFGHTTPSLIGFIETLEKESRLQADRLEHIRKGLIVTKKRRREENLIEGEFDKPCMHYNQYKENKEDLE